MFETPQPQEPLCAMKYLLRIFFSVPLTLYFERAFVSGGSSRKKREYILPLLFAKSAVKANSRLKPTNARRRLSHNATTRITTRAIAFLLARI